MGDVDLSILTSSCRLPQAAIVTSLTFLPTLGPVKAITLGAFLSLLAISAAAAESAPSDLRLEWVDTLPVVEGTAGATIELKYLLRNLGGRDAFAVILKSHTSLGPAGAPLRLQPGPAAGRAMERKLALPLAIGMRELCIEASLQNRQSDEPADPNLRDNRICRAVRVTEAQGE